MPKKIYVGNLNYDTNETSLNNLFAEFGEIVSLKIITDQFSGRSKGFAFIEMSDEDEASNAITSLNGKELDGRTLKVNEAFEKAKNKKQFRNKRYY
jgi:RNA recognition motif-containing protein